MKKQVQVAAAVLIDAAGQVLLGRRQPDTAYTGYWEFPGGKIEDGESAFAALARELHEELGITVTNAEPWLFRRHSYEHADVELNFFRVRHWQGAIQQHIHAELSWQNPHALTVSPMLPANGPLLKSLRLAQCMRISHAWQIGVDVQLHAIAELLRQPNQNSRPLIQLREAALGEPQRLAFYESVLALPGAQNADIIINISANSATSQLAELKLVESLGAHGVHLSSAALAACTNRPELKWLGASCHSRAELDMAEKLAVDYALLGHVLETPTHEHQAALGWRQFAQLATKRAMPIFAIGGMTAGDLTEVSEHGGHGIACIRAAWPTTSMSAEQAQ